MADDQALDGGTGTNPYTAAADDVGGAKYQRVKISVGADGVVGDATPSNPVPVRISDGASAQTPVRVDNQAFTDNASNITPGGYLFDEVAGTALTENDAAAARIDAKRAQILVIEDANTRGQRAVVDAAGAQLVYSQAQTPQLSNVAASASSVTLQAANAARKGLVIVNDSTSILYIKYGSAASTTSYTYFLAGSVGGVPATFEMPLMVYTGIVTGIWASATGNARVTELA